MTTEQIQARVPTPFFNKMTTDSKDSKDKELKSEIHNWVTLMLGNIRHKKFIEQDLFIFVKIQIDIAIQSEQENFQKEREEMLEDIKKMLIVLSALTPEDTEGKKVLNDWQIKYKLK